jgi:hypothetical protein
VRTMCAVVSYKSLSRKQDTLWVQNPLRRLSPSGYR